MSHAPTFPFGLTPVARKPDSLEPCASSPPHIRLEQLTATIPTTPLVAAAVAHLKPLLPEPIWNHSYRAYLHGQSCWPIHHSPLGGS